MKLRKTAFLLCAMLTASAAFGQGQFRNIASLAFDYYTDGRYGLNWENVFLSPLQRGFYLISSVQGRNASSSNILGGRLGLAFDLPGAFYGESSYALEYDDVDEGLLHSFLTSATYESGPAIAGISLMGEFKEGSAGGILSPSIQYYVVPRFSLSGKVFAAFHHYDPEDAFFNFAILGSGEYALAPDILLSLGATFGTVHEPIAEYEKWSILGGLKVVPSSTVSIKTLFEFTNARSHPTNPHDLLTSYVIVDIKFPRRK